MAAGPPVLWTTRGRRPSSLRPLIDILGPILPPLPAPGASSPPAAPAQVAPAEAARGPAPRAAARRTFRLLLEYDGTDFSGWQVQPRGRTVQGVIEEAIGRITGATCRVTGAGRTDAGVHALGQVASFSVETPLTARRLGEALNGVLPPDVIVREAADAAAGFNARRDAREREYEYRIDFVRRAVGRGYAWRLRSIPDLDAVRQGAGLLVGRHDFTSFCVTAHERESRFCDLRECSVQELEYGLRFRLCADRFLRAMVRSIVGTLIDVGRGRLAAGDVGRILQARDRRLAGPSAPAKGLLLMRVVYEPGSGPRKGDR